MLPSISTEALGFFCIQVKSFRRDKALPGAEEVYLHCLVKLEQSHQSSLPFRLLCCG